MIKPTHYNLATNGGGIYSLRKTEGENSWFQRGKRISDSTVILSLNSEINTNAKLILVEVIPSELPTVPFGFSFKDIAISTTISQQYCESLTVMVEPSSDSQLEISFDSGSSWVQALGKGEVKTWTGSATIDLRSMRFRPFGGSGVVSFDIHGVLK